MFYTRELFYHNVVNELISSKKASILVCGGGHLDKMCFEKLGFSDVVISNLDSKIIEDEFSPFKWKYENAESLSFSDKSFDYVVIHAAIHHASSPHKMLTEMYRVAKIAILAVESRDSIVMRFMEKYGFSQTYEHSAVYYNECKYGGVNNTEIPNYIYRWTEREIEKTIQSYDPYYVHKFIYRYGANFPATSELESKAMLKVIFLKCMRPLYQVFIKLFPRQQNLFAFFIEKPNKLRSTFPMVTL